MGVERHGAVRLDTAQELFDVRRLFAVMGMYPIGYYDFSLAGVSVHSTAFRLIADEALRRNPFRVFTSLLRLELIEDPELRARLPRALDLDAVQAGMPGRGIVPKAVIEGPPRRNCPILLRQTSFKALEGPIVFRHWTGETAAGTHTARFGEIEQRGVALTAKGRSLYDELLASVRRDVQIGAAGSNASSYQTELSGTL